MRFFIDTEFIEAGPRKPIQLISIAIVAENGAAYYDVSSEFNPEDANDWVKANVLPHIEPWGDKRTLSEIAERIKNFVASQSSDKPEFWGYYADYDWVVFCQIFGAMIDLPKGRPMYCRDIKQWCDAIGNPILPKQESTEHNALHDARWNLATWNYLENLARVPAWS